jgi:hypothetical protein
MLPRSVVGSIPRTRTPFGTALSLTLYCLCPQSTTKTISHLLIFMDEIVLYLEAEI